MSKLNESAILFTSLILLFLSGASHTAQAAELAGVTMEDSLALGDQKLVLNGQGIRKAFLTIKVYVAGLYVAEKTQDADKILNSSTPKRLAMEFKMVVERQKIVDAWEKGYAENCSAKCGDGTRPQLKELLALMTDMREKQKMIIDFYSDRIEVNFRDEKKATIQGAEFSKNVLSIFLGKNPPNSGLKEGLLGKS